MRRPVAGARRLARGSWEILAFAAVAFVPLLLSKPGLLVDDTKIYLYLDPGRLVTQAAQLWSHVFAFGTVTHQNIGYLLPMGPFYWGAHGLGVPMWIAQRLWMGSLLFFAAIGVRRCARELGLSRFGSNVAAVPYMLTPYILVNLDRTSAIIMPWAGLGWMMLYTIRAARRNDWRNPALFAIIVALVGGVNATSILMVAFAPLLYLLAAAHAGEIPWRRCVAVIWRVGILSLLVSVWWAAGLWAEGKYGINILRFTESFATVTSTSTSSEVFRGLGYWYFYGRDGLQPWTLSSLAYLTGKFVPTASVVVPLGGFIAALVIRWRYRLWAAAICLVGVVVAVGSYPLAHPTPIGEVFKYLATHTTAALALRSSNRVLPILVLGLSLLAGAGFQALRTRHPQRALIGAGVFGLIAVVGMLPLFEGKAIASNLTLPSTLPSYVLQAAQVLDQGSQQSNVLGLPGQDFSYYRFGASSDSIWPGLTDRPWLSDQVQLEGEPASITLIRGLDSTLANGVAVPSSIAPIARLFNAGDVLVQMNLEYERYSSPLPTYMWNLFDPTPKGMTLVGTYGPTVNFQASNGPYIDESILGLPQGYQWPQSLAIYKVKGVRPLVRTEANRAPELVAGNGEGLVTMAETGLLNNDRPIFFDAAESRTEISRLANEPGAWLVLTDSNQRRLDTFGSLDATEGYVMTATEQPLSHDPQELTLSEFPHEPAGSQTVALLRGLAAVGASGYGNVITNNPEDQPANAFDGSTLTSWSVAAFEPAIGQFIQATALAPQMISKIHLVQNQSISQNRYITEVGIQVNGGHMYVRALGPASNLPTGQTVTIPPTRGSTVRITILNDSDHDQDVGEASAIGFAEIGIPGFGPASNGLLLPTSLLSSVGRAASTDRLTVVLNRLRAATVPPRLDPEYSLLRYFELPDARTFSIQGLANLNPAAPDSVINALLGRHPGPGVSVVDAEASTELTGSLNDTAWAAFDGNPQTAWETRFRPAVGNYLKVQLTAPVTVHHFSLTIINDGYHTVPTEMAISNGQRTEDFAIPATVAAQTGTLNGSQTFNITVPAITGDNFTFTLEGFDLVRVIDRVSGGPNFAPIGIDSISLPGVTPGVTPRTFSTGCRTDLLKVDGTPIGVTITGTTSAALNQDQLHIGLCGNSTLRLAPGLQTVQSRSGVFSGLNFNTLVLNSEPITPLTHLDTLRDRPAHWVGQTVVRSTVTPADAGRWLVLAQSYSTGWEALLNGRSLGPPTLIDGASMGWLLPRTISSTEHVAFVWEPQQTVNDALVLSGFGVLLALGLAIFKRPRRRRVAPALAGPPEDATPQWTGLSPRVTVGAPLLALGAVLLGLAVSLYLVPVLLVAAWVWTRRPSVGRLVAVGAVAGVVVAGAFTVSATLGSFTRDISWPNHVDYANTAAWLGLVLWALYVLGTSTWRAAPPAAAEVVEVPDAPPRRRGLNVPAPPPDAPPEPGEVETVPLGGLRRTTFLLRAIIRNRDQPEAWQSILSEDSINQVVGKTPLFNRRVLDISDFAVGHAVVLAERGAHVTAMRRQAPPSGRTLEHEPTAAHAAPVLEFTPNHLPAPDHSFDLVFATNVLSSVEHPEVLVDELVRVLRPGGTLYVQNVMWNSILGGRETSPWHLISGRFARRYYRRRHGREPVNRYGVNFFKVTPRRLLRVLRQRPELAVFLVGPRYLPLHLKWAVHVPVLRSLIVADLVVVAERR